MALVIEPAIWERFPGMLLVVAVAADLDNQREQPAVQAMLEAVQAELRASWSYDNPQSHPRVKAWRDAFQHIGVSGKNFPSSIEALCRRVLSGKGLAPINPLVDFYNAVSLRFIVPAGGWDLDSMKGDLALRLTEGGESFHELGGQGEPVTVGAGEVSYADADEIITRHFVWRQAERAKVAPQTRRLFLVSEILPEAGREVAEGVARAFLEGLRDLFGQPARVAILEPGTARWS